MIVEVGLFGIDEARTEAFEPVAQDIRAAFDRGGIAGLRFFQIAPSLEDAARWVVLVGWDSVAAHENFVASEEGQRQRVLLDRFMVGSSEVLHLALDDVTEGLH